MSGLVRQAAEVLRASGGRMTNQRRAILETLEEIGGHPTAEEIYAAARRRDASINPSTVYRTLNWLGHAGLLGAAWLGPERSRRQEALPGSNLGEHHHFVCVRCGQVIEFAAPEIEHIKRAVASRYGVLVERAGLTLNGLCAGCRAQYANGLKEEHGTLEHE